MRITLTAAGWTCAAFVTISLNRTFAVNVFCAGAVIAPWCI